METKTNIQCNKLVHKEDSMVMYGVYSAEMLERLIKNIPDMHLRQTLHKKSFAG